MPAKIGSAQSHSLCYGGTLGHDNFRTTQTRKDKRKPKEFTYNYVDRIRLGENFQQDYNYPHRGSGWRHNKSISHLDLATNCHAATSELGHWPNTRQLRYSRSLEYNRNIDRCKGGLDDICEFYWHIDPGAEFHQNNERPTLSRSLAVEQKTNSSKHDETLFTSHNCGDENYHSSKKAYPQQQQLQYQNSIPAFEYDGEACSLRRSRSLAVIREETFSDLQINSANKSFRRSQLIPRARLVNQHFLQDCEELFCNSAQRLHHHQHNVLHKKCRPSNVSNEQDIPITGDRCDSVNGGADICCSSQQHHTQHKNQNQHKQKCLPNGCDVRHNRQNESRQQASETETAVDYYDKFNSVDSIATCFVEQLHPWHNDKSDLESLNSDYFKNSLHQNHENNHHLDVEILEDATSLLANGKPRIYQSRRAPLRSHIAERFCYSKRHKSESTLNGSFTAADSCPENSQSSVFPETTTSNSDDQTDSPSLSEQEYDLKKIEQIFQKIQPEDENENENESYDLISLTTPKQLQIKDDEVERKHITSASGESSQDDQSNASVKESYNTKHATGKADTESTLKHSKTLSKNLKKLIAYDSVYLSSEEGSDDTLFEGGCEYCLERRAGDKSTLLQISIEDTVYEPHKVIIEQNCAPYTHTTCDEKSPKSDSELQNWADICSTEQLESPLYAQVIKSEQFGSGSNVSTIGAISDVTFNADTTKPKKYSVIEKRTLKRYSAENSTHFAVCKQLPDITTQLATQRCQHYKNLISISANSPFRHFNNTATATATATANASVYLPHLSRENIWENQYHSLPDINISKSLNVSECIDAELRSSYNYNKGRCTNVNFHPQKAKTSAPNQQNIPIKELRNLSEPGEHNYDSIKRFGPKNKKTRQLEYEKGIKSVSTTDDKQNSIEQDTDKCKSPEGKDHETSANDSETRKQFLLPAVSQSTTLLIEPLKRQSINSTEGTNQLCRIEINSNTTIDKSVSNECQELPKESPDEVEVSNFSKEIYECTNEIKKCRKLRQKYNSFDTLDFTSETLRVRRTKEENNIATHNTADVYDHHRLRIIVTDAQNNIIEEDSIDGNCSGNTFEEADPIPEKEFKCEQEGEEKSSENSTATFSENTVKKRSSFSINQNKVSSNKTIKRVPLKSRRQIKQLRQNLTQQDKRSKGNESADKHLNFLQTSSRTAHDTSVKLKEHRLLGTRIYKTRPFRASAPNDSFRCSTNTNVKMSRPQILQVVGGKRIIELVNGAEEAENSKVENEYLRKVNAVRYYWSKLVEGDIDRHELRANAKNQIQVNSEFDEDHTKLEPNEEETDNPAQKPDVNELSQLPEKRHFIVGAHERSSSKNGDTLLTATSPSSIGDCCDFMPSIEIIELDGDKKATIVSAVPFSESSSNEIHLEASKPLFDHIRYKVLKSQQLLRNNLIPRSKKGTQFEGLIQYLQDYSFQELLSNNNVVIVEPVRTKVDLPLQSKSEQRNAKKAAANQKTSNCNGLECISRTDTSNGSGSGTGSGSGCGIRRHFFYQPVRVNRELYEEELPNPDTVRNVRKFFEDNSGKREALQRSKKGDLRIWRDRKFRILKIDTSYEHTPASQQQDQQKSRQNGQADKWDVQSISNGITDPKSSASYEGDTIDTTAETNTPIKRDPTINGNCVFDSGSVEIVHPQKFKQHSAHIQHIVRWHYSQNTNRDSISARMQSVGIDSVRIRGPCCAFNDTSKDSDKGAEYLTGETNDNEMDYYDDNNLYDTHYVSNEVLQKIRECGSSVTYYGGRVLQSNQTESTKAKHLDQQHGGTYSRLCDTATCSVCQPHEFMDKSQVNDNLLTHDRPKDAGTKFKLMKSNSCNSRLEMACAYNDVNDPKTEETDVVRRIVSQFERNSQTMGSAVEEQVTINNQTPLIEQDHRECQDGRRVTVNNHINMPQQPSETTTSGSGMKRIIERREDGNKHANSCQPNAEEYKEKGISGRNTFHTSSQTKSENNGTGHVDQNKNSLYGGSSSRKIIRNKNVDLAFKFAQESRVKPNETLKNSEKLPSVPKSRSTYNNNINNINRKSTNEIITTLPNTNGINVKSSAATTSETDLSCCDRFNSISLASNRPNEVGNAVTEGTIKDEQKTDSQRTVPVPIQMHCNSESISNPFSCTEHALCVNTASSTFSVIEKNVVRHYVANDKSLFEKRKFDDIKFEEFEVYDLSKEVKKQRDNLRNDIHTESGDNGNYDEEKHTKSSDRQCEESMSPSNHTDVSSLIDHDGDPDYKCFTSGSQRESSPDWKSKSETDCYDSLNDKE